MMMTRRQPRNAQDGAPNRHGSPTIALALLCASLILAFAPGLHNHAGPDAKEDCTLCRVTSTSPLDLPSPVASLAPGSGGPGQSLTLATIALPQAAWRSGIAPRGPPSILDRSNAA
jgi:hypothetical protein